MLIYCLVLSQINLTALITKDAFHHYGKQLTLCPFQRKKHQRISTTITANISISSFVQSCWGICCERTREASHFCKDQEQLIRLHSQVLNNACVNHYDQFISGQKTLTETDVLFDYLSAIDSIDHTILAGKLAKLRIHIISNAVS